MNPWMPENEAQRNWTIKWAHEYSVCHACKQSPNCTVRDRQDIATCKLLKERNGK